MDSLEIWITRVAAVLGALALGLPLLRVWRSRNAIRGRRFGSTSLLLGWPMILALTAVYVFVGILLWKPIPLEPTSSLRLILTLLGTFLYIPGIILYMWGFKTLGSMFGVSNIMAVELYKDHRLVEDGPYAIVRHPMYLSIILIAFGALMIFRTWTMVIYAPTALGIIGRARREEKILADEFGKAWESYRKRVPGWIPRIRLRLKNDN